METLVIIAIIVCGIFSVVQLACAAKFFRQKETQRAVNALSCAGITAGLAALVLFGARV